MSPSHLSRRRGLRGWARWVPGVLVAGYLAATSALYLSSAVPSGVAPAVGLTALFSGAVVVAVLGGYAFGLRGAPVENEAAPATGAPVPPVHLLLVVGAACWWLAFGVASMLNRGISGPADLAARIVDPRGSYYAKFDELGAGVSPVLQLLTLTGILYWLLIPLTVLYWQRLPWVVRLLSLAGIGSYALLFLGTGTQKGVVDVCLQVGISVVAVAVARGRLKLRHLLAAAVLVVAGAALVVTSLGQRTDATSTVMQLGANTEHAAALEPVLGEEAARGVVVLRDYGTQGYRGLAYSLEMPFEWTYGVGSMRSLSSYLPQYAGLADPYERTYPVRVEESYAWSATEKWTTVYPWLASDLTFPGALVILGLLGWSLARAWQSFRVRSDAWSLVSLVVLAVFFLFAPANNQLFNDRYSAIGILMLLAILAARGLRSRVTVIERGHRFVSRAAGYIVRNIARWRARLGLGLVNRVSRRRLVDPDGTATVSVTTFAARLPAVHIALESIGRGRTRPARVVLWVDDDVVEQARASATLGRLVRRGLEIRGAEAALGPHKKYVHAVAEFDDLAEESGTVLVVADDDIVYPREWLEELMSRFEDEGRRAVVSWWVKQYRFEEDGSGLAPYRTWDSAQDTQVRQDHYLMGGSGTAFPDRMVHELRARGREFLDCAPRADDIWLNMVALRTGVGVAQVRALPLPILTVPSTQRTKLSHENVTGNLNDQQLHDTFDAHDLAQLRGMAGVET